MRFVWLNALCLSLCLFSSLACAQPELKLVETQQLHNVWQLSPRIMSGSEPEDEAAFAELAKLGVKTVVSVDGIAPRIDLAKKHGLSYVHIPIGYDGIDATARGSLTRVAQDIAGLIYVHCHHGKHRGPAAAAILCRADDGRSSAEAREILEKAGTGKEYPGLWSDVEKFVRPAKDVNLPALTERAQVESLAGAMAKLDRTFDRLKLCAKHRWQPLPKDPDVSALLEAVQLTELFTEAARATSATPLKGSLEQAARQAESLRYAVSQGDRMRADQLMTSLTNSCTACHKDYRN